MDLGLELFIGDPYEYILVAPLDVSEDEIRDVIKAEALKIDVQDLADGIRDALTGLRIVFAVYDNADRKSAEAQEHFVVIGFQTAAVTETE